MAGRALAHGSLNAISGKFSRRCTSHLDRDVSLSQEPLLKGSLGESVRARPSDGQVSGSMATLLAPDGQQPSCFPCETVQAPFVFHGSRHERTFDAATPLQGRQHIHLRMRAWTRETRRWQGGKSTGGSKQHRPPTTGERRDYKHVGRTFIGVGKIAVSQEYTRSSAALPPGRTGERAGKTWRGMWSAQRLFQLGATTWARSHAITVRFEETGGLTIFHPQAHPAPVANSGRVPSRTTPGSCTAEERVGGELGSSPARRSVKL